MRLPFFIVALLVPVVPAFAAPAPQGNLDGLFAKLQKVQSSEDAKPIEKQILSEFLQSNSATVDVLMSHAAVLLDAGEGKTAGTILDSITRIAPAYAEGWHQKGKLEADAGHDEAALASLQKAVKLNPRQFEALVELGDMLAQYGAKPAALASYKKALTLDPHLEGLDRRVQQLTRDVEGEKI